MEGDAVLARIGAGGRRAPSSSVLFRHWLGVIPLLGILSNSCANPSAPGSVLTGVWVAHSVPLLDSLLVVILDGAGQVEGYGRPYPITPDWHGSGTRTGSHVDLTLCRFGFCSVIQADIDRFGSRLQGTIDSAAVEFTKSHPVVGGLPGTWVLTRISDSTALPDNAVSDTVHLVGDGHLRRFVSRVSGCAATKVGFYRLQSSVAILEYFDLGLPSQFNCGIDKPDTLSVVGATLVRRTVVGGAVSVDESYERR
jgi:hypothetical protein